jgi:hypothetical protein
MGSMDVYVADFEAALLDSSRAYYARKVKIAFDDFMYILSQRFVGIDMATGRLHSSLHD